MSSLLASRKSVRAQENADLRASPAGFPALKAFCPKFLQPSQTRHPFPLHMIKTLQWISFVMLSMPRLLNPFRLGASFSTRRYTEEEISCPVSQAVRFESQVLPKPQSCGKQGSWL